MKVFSNNAELYQYLFELSAKLTERSAKELSEVVSHASRCSAGMSTEFLGESRIALRRVLTEEQGALSPKGRIDVEDALRQIDDAFERRL
jgi:hypothetical protein